MEESRLRYAELVGQNDVITRLKAFTELFASSGGIPAHILFTGDVGMGQSTLAKAVANERGIGFSQVNAASLQIVGDFTAIVTNLRAGQVLFLSDLHLLRKPLPEKLRDVLRNGTIPITIGKGSAARTHSMNTPPFTLIATCPRKLDCPPDLLSEFSLILSLQPYSPAELQMLTVSIGRSMRLTVEPDAAALIARCCDGRPGQIASSLRRLTKAINTPLIRENDVSRAFAAFGITVRPNASIDGAASIQDLSGADFERLITNLLTQMGFQAEMTRTTGDGGIDIVAVLDRPIVGGRYLFQCKRFSPENIVGAPTVRDFFGGVMADRAVKGIFITTSSFTPQAREFAEKAGVELIDCGQLKKLLLEYGAAALRDE